MQFIGRIDGVPHVLQTLVPTLPDANLSRAELSGLPTKASVSVIVPVFMQ